MSNGEHVHTSGEFIELAKDTLHGFVCDWDHCKSGLNSWNRLAKHLQQHCMHVSHEGGYYKCQYKTCASRLHASRQDLVDHILYSHMSRVYLPCPFQGCTIFLRHGQNLNQIVDHVADSHAECFDARKRHITVATSRLKPSQHPVKPTILPLDLVATMELSAGSRLVQDLLPLNIHRKPHHKAAAAAITVQDPKDMVWGYINSLRVEDKAEKERVGYIPSGSLSLPPMPTHQAQLNDLPPQDIGVHRKPPDLPTDPAEKFLSRPVTIPTSTLTLEPPPCTIGYDVLAAILHARAASPDEPAAPQRRSRSRRDSTESDESRPPKRANRRS